jgi:membrane protease YdiL (CAAX protease family)
MVQKPTTSSTSAKAWERPVLIVIPYMIVVGIFQWVGFTILGLDPNNFQAPKTLFQDIILKLFTLSGTIVVVYLSRWQVDNESFRSLGFNKKGIWKELMIGLTLGAVLIATGFSVLFLTDEIVWAGTNVYPQNILLGFILFALVAFSEELLFRGYILNNLMKSMPGGYALIICSVSFSLIHVFNSGYNWLSFWNLTMAGMLLGLPYIFTKSLWLPIALHLSWNFFQGTIFGFSVSGNITYSLIEQTRLTDNLWNGGKFGFEGSVLSIVLQLIAFMGLWWYYHRKSIGSVVTDVGN